jgi:hypothetical protein
MKPARTVILAICTFVTLHTASGQWTLSYLLWSTDGDIVTSATFSSGESLLLVGDVSGILASSDTGRSYTFITHGPGSMVRNILTCGDTVIAGSLTSGVYRSVDHCTNWVQSNSGLSDKSVVAMCKYRSTLFLSTSNHNVFTSQDNGVTWLANGTGLSPSDSITRFYAEGDTIFATSPNNQTIFCYANDGPWRRYATYSRTYYVTLIKSKNTIYAGSSAGSGGGIFHSNDYGKTWSAETSPPTLYSCTALYDAPTGIFAVGGGDFVHSPGGVSFAPPGSARFNYFGDGLLPSTVSSIYQYADRLFLVNGYGVYTRPVKEVLTESEDIPQAVGSAHNATVYPQPLSSGESAILAVDLATPTHLEAKLFDHLGRPIASICEVTLSAGRHTVVVPAQYLSNTGTYFLRISTGSEATTRRLVIIR